MSTHRRKITLYNGEEVMSELSPPSTASNREILKLVQYEFARVPVLTHAIYRDRQEHLWRIKRHDSWFKKVCIALKAS